MTPPSCTSTSTSFWRRSNCAATPNSSGCRSSSAATAIRPNRARSSPAPRMRPASSACTRACRCAAPRAAVPEATFLPSDPAAYDAASDEVMGLLRDLGHPVEVWGWDEAYVGLETGDPTEVAEQIRTIVLSETGLSCSVGISDNKQRAKVATGFAKPAGVFALTDANWMSVMADRPVDALWGVGPKTAKKLAALDITTVGQLARTDAELLTSTFGPRTGLWLLLLAKGGGDTEVSAAPWVPRSRSHVVTFARDLTDRAEMDQAVTGFGPAHSGRRCNGGAGRRPGRGHRAHRHVLHPHQDPQAGRTQHRSGRHRRGGAADPGPVRAGPPGPFNRSPAGTRDA